MLVRKREEGLDDDDDAAEVEDGERAVRAAAASVVRLETMALEEFEFEIDPSTATDGPGLRSTSPWARRATARRRMKR